jgi:D-alanyl-D-alanine carboxypeptidase/D-alanyl-D-alanine-endopeptidase (penicillin-binding protein 4)
MAERLGESIGGIESVRRQIQTSFSIPPDELMISSVSGLGVNRVTPRAMMKIFRALRDELDKNHLLVSDILPVAGIDPGTLEARFTDPGSRGSVIAKTGTLTRTDGGASSLVGQMKSANGEVLLFVIMNQRGNVLRFRENQDYLVSEVQKTRGGPKAFNYHPVALAMKLVDIEATSAPETDEYEPPVKRD